MKHLDPNQVVPRPLARPVERRPSRAAWLATTAAVVAGLGGLGTWLWGVDSNDRVSDSERQTRLSAYQSMDALEVRWIDPANVATSVQAMALGPADRQKLQQALETSPDSNASPAAAPNNAPLRLAAVQLWDTHAADGDVVSIRSGGYAITVTITHAVQDVVVPIDGTATLSIVGIHDGGGGITLGVRGPNGDMLAPIMVEGQVLSFPVMR